MSRSFPQGFAQGLRSTDLRLLFFVALFLPISYLGLEWGLRSGVVFSLGEGRLLLSDTDQTTHMAFRLHQLKAAPSHRGVFLLGGSAMRESIEGPEELEREIRSLGISRGPVEMFGSYNQSFEEGRLLLD